MLAKLFVKRLASVVEISLRETKTRVIMGSSIHDKLLSIRYTFEQLGQTSGKCRTLVHLDQSKLFSRVNHGYLAAVLETVSLGPNFGS